MNDYYHKQQQCEYYDIVNALIADLVDADPTLQSIIDVGCWKSRELERWNVKHKTAFDFWEMPEFSGAECIQGDLTTYNFLKQEWDIVVCLQVLEHIKKVELAIANLFSIASSYVIISLPYKWPKGKEPGHVHDPIDSEKLLDWFAQIKPIWHISSAMLCDDKSRIIYVFKR